MSKTSPRAAEDLPSLELVRELLDYDPDTGVFVWKRSIYRGRPTVGSVAGCLKDGYRRINIGNRHCYAHRLAWFMTHGRWPELIDHINGDRSDNRLVNLREADKSINMLNGGRALAHNKCGLRGVYLEKNGRRWLAEIGWRKTHYHLGGFTSKEAAHAAYLIAASAFQSGWLLPKGVEFRLTEQGKHSSPV